MTFDYSSNFDFFARPQDKGSSGAETRATRDFRNLLQVQPLRDRRGRPIEGVMEWTITIHNLSGGLNRVWGVAREPSPYYPYSDLDRASSSTLLTHDLGLLTLPPKTTLDSVGETNFVPVSFCNIFGTMAIAAGTLANNALLIETSGTNPALTALTYAPGSRISCLVPVVIGGATVSQRLAVGFSGAANPVNILTDVANPPTSAGNMNASTGSCWGILSSPLNSASPGTPTLLIYSSGQLWTLDGTSAIGTAPTSATGGVASIPNGGYAVGIVSLPGVPTRAYWFFPPQDQAQASIYDNAGGGTPFRTGYLVSTNLEATDIQVVKCPIRVMFAGQIADDEIWISDGLSVWQIKDQIRNLGWATQRVTAASDNFKNYRCWGFMVADGVGHVVSVMDTRSVSTGLIQIERYQESTNSWHAVSTSYAPTGGIAVATSSSTDTPDISSLWVLGPVGGLHAYSSKTRNSHIAVYGSTGAGTGRYRRQYIPPSNYPPFYFGLPNSGAFEDSGSFTSPAMTMEGLEGYPSIIREVRCMGDLANNSASGLGAQIQFDFAGQGAQGASFLTFSGNTSAVFNTADRAEAMFKPFPPDHRDFFTRLQYKVTLTSAGASSALTPNGLPFIIRGYTFTDGKTRSIGEVEAMKAG